METGEFGRLEGEGGMQSRNAVRMGIVGCAVALCVVMEWGFGDDKCEISCG